MTKQEDPLDESITVVKTGTCETLSGKSKLTYHVGRDPEDALYFRIHKNTGGGFFSREWVALKNIQKVFAEVPEERPITAIVLDGLFKGKSVNTPGFLLAVLVKEKLLMPMKGKKRSHEAVDPEEFMEKVERLTSAEMKPKAAIRKTARKTGGNTGGNTGGKTTAASKKKARIKKRSAASRKKQSRTV
ncbi:MAG: hypothetical protein ABFS22_09745 [Pseudomonadota bacterium]